MTTGPVLQQIVVSSDYDVITMRQEIRLNARSFGMVLSQQARITAAVSAVARTMLATNSRVIFTIQQVAHDLGLAMEVACAAPLAHTLCAARLESIYNDSEIRTLVDDANLATKDDMLWLTFRMWLERPSARDRQYQ